MTELIKIPSLLNSVGLQAYWRMEDDKEINTLALLLADSALKGYWRMENVNDTSPSGYTLTNNGTATFSSGKFSNAAILNGSNQWFTITNASAPDLYTIGDQTICAWVKPGGFAGDECIFSNANNGATTGFVFQTQVTTGKLQLKSFKSGDDQAVTSTNALIVGQWNFVAVKYTSSGQAVTLIVNGIKTTGSFSRAMVATTADTEIGRSAIGGGISYYFGDIDDLAFFSRTLTDNELFQIYGLSDSSSHRNGLTRINNPSAVTGRYNYGHDFEASSSQSLYIEDNTAVSIVGDLTIALWAKWESHAGAGTEEMGLVGKYNVAPNSDFLFLWNDNGDNLQFYMSDDGSSVDFAQVGFTPVLGRWYHLAVVYDSGAGSAKFYVDAVHVGGGSGLGNSIHNGNTPLRVGAYGTPSAFFDGVLDDVSVWSRMLDQNEIRKLAKAGSGMFLLM